MTKESMEFDVVIVGAGPAGLSCGIRLAQLANQTKTSLSICIIDKAPEIGAHSLSGAVLEPRALDELIPDWESKSFPTHTPVKDDQFLYLTKKRVVKLPTPPQMNNHGNFIISLGQFCRWLGQEAEHLDINVFPGFAATEILYDQNRVIGVGTGDKGINRQGEQKPQYQPGMALLAKQVIFAEGCRGSLTQTLFTKFNLRAQADPQTYGIGIKELWKIPTHLHKPGTVIHSIGWPLTSDIYGGSFIYHFGEDLISIGFVTGLDYQNPYFNPYEEFQRFKLHPAVKPLLENSTRLAYGARTLVEGGLQSLPKLSFPGGVIVGDAAGFLNVAKIKGIHCAMKSGMLAADSLFPLLSQTPVPECTQYKAAFRLSWLRQELYRVRNIRPAFRWGLLPALCYSAIDTYILRGNAPWTLHHRHPDHLALKKASLCRKIEYPKHDNKITFDISQSVYLANVSYDEDQPYHLKLKDRWDVPIRINLNEYAAPETRYCPAGVYETVYDENNKPKLHINGGNCIHCKACDIKDPTQNITWTPSEGGSGPFYQQM